MPLVVDLDDTLLRTDLLLETFWAGLSRDWRVLPGAALELRRGGKAGLKRYLADAGPVQPALLPYNEEAIDVIRARRAQGGQVILVTASDQALAETVAGHLGLFDAVHGSDGVRNLKGPAKAAFLSDMFGTGGFAYMGDSAADLPVWKAAGEALTVNADAGLRRRAESAAGGPTRHLGAAARRPGPYLRQIRPHQWLKNMLVFLPAIAAHQFDAATLLAAFAAFVAFSLIASSVYVLNDLLDLASDRSHLRKRERPFASGAVPLSHGTWMAAGLIAGGVALSALLGPLFLLVMAVYYALTVAYSMTLKRRLMVDIVTLACLYTLRLLAGGAATGIGLSVWLLAFSMFLFLALAAVKRQAELVDGAARGTLTAHGRGYHVDDLPIVTAMAIASGYVSVLVMALYLNGPDVTALYGNPVPLWGICVVLLYWISRMVMVTHRGWMTDDPIVYAVKDRVSRVCGVIVLACAVAGTLL